MTDDHTPPTVAALSDDRSAAVVDVLLDILAIDTQNPPGETAPLAEYIEANLQDAGIPTERVAVDPAKPNVLAHVEGDRDETLLFNGHMDTVPYDADAWDHDPLGERDGDRIFGRGATDMKGPLAAMLVVARAMATMDEDPPLDVAFAFVSEEEVPGDAGLESLLEADRLHAEACIVGENTCENGRHSVTVADRGSIWLTLRAVGEAAHGSRPVFGTNAIDRLYAAIDDLRESLTHRELSLDTRLDRILEESVDFYGPMIGREQAWALFEHPTVNLGTFDGGEAVNSVPESATARLDVRLTAGVETPAVLADIRGCLQGHPGVTIAESSWSVGTFEDPEGPLVSAVAETAESVVGERVYRRSATGGGDAKKLRNAGISTVEFALGTDTAHAVDEYTTTDALAANVEVYARVPSVLASSYENEDPR